MTFPYSFYETLTLYDINAEAQSLFSLLLLEKYSSACIQMTKDGTDKKFGSKLIIICRNHNSVLSSCAMYDVLDYSVLYSNALRLVICSYLENTCITASFH